MISIQQEDFNPGLEQDNLSKLTGTGAVVTFTGLVRDENLGDDVGGLYLEHYPGMTEKALQEIIDEAAARWPLQAIKVIHRVGQLHPGDRIVYVGVASAHRRAAFEICEFVMDYLKTRAPFWKRETTVDGERWVDARESDKQSAERWYEE
ncbi:molybdopterin synthase catalytic subunit MoaE [Endozoicomonas sp. OPT23]|uniref:molybdopterin synthase catalytic subunit MoaE n=1 Tax=Endozoicomonas sp. OPT23 TaxID=2072845 RepID=UPI00129B9518|nr:molybdopterin synthase catalytic subunit MoaE [Endozoicomonas sp. OPT23]MRI33524.1 molybdopterin synthase catalytic subunit MoaE [Endozoicomonas sp. OPT23]